MKKLSVLLVVLVVLLVFSLTACGGGDKNKVTDGDISTCLALNGPDVRSWTFSTLERVSNNVCYIYQVQTAR